VEEIINGIEQVNVINMNNNSLIVLLMSTLRLLFFLRNQPATRAVLFVKKCR